MAMTAALLQMARFGAVGLLNTALGLAAIYVCMYVLSVGTELANALGYAVGLSLGFWLNRRWTFASTRRIGDAAPRYALVVAGAWLINLVVVSLTARSGMNPYLAQICGVAPYTALCFLGCRFYVFSKAVKTDLDYDRA